jgi:hypothetical protein
MRRIALWAGVAVIIVLALSLSQGRFSASAQSGGSYDLRWNTMDNGGGGSSGGAYTLNGTIGQFDAGGATGGIYTLGGGFWGGRGTPLQSPVFLPLIRR